MGWNSIHFNSIQSHPIPFASRLSAPSTERDFNKSFFSCPMKISNVMTDLLSSETLADDLGVGTDVQVSVGGIVGGGGNGPGSYWAGTRMSD